MAYAMFFLGIAAASGAALGAFRLKDREPPVALAMVHGLIALVGVVVLIFWAFTQKKVPGILIASIVLFITTLFGGLVAMSYHVRGKLLPLPLVALHATAGVNAYVFLIASYLSMGA